MFLPVTMDSAERIIETIQEIKLKIPSDPFEAELILMAEMVAEQDENNKPERPKAKVEKRTERRDAPDGERRYNSHVMSFHWMVGSWFFPTQCISLHEDFHLFILQTTPVTSVTIWIQKNWPVSSTTGRTPPPTRASGRRVGRSRRRSSTRRSSFLRGCPASLTPSPRLQLRLPWTSKLTSLSVRRWDTF